MSAVKCIKKSSSQICEKFSAKKLLKFVKVVKPVLKLMRAQRPGTVTPSVCNYDVVESFQNDLNESELFQLDFKFFDSDETEDNLRNEQLEKLLLLEKLDVVDVSPCLRCSSWTVRSDVDVCKRGDDYLTSRQTAEQQTPVVVV